MSDKIGLLIEGGGMKCAFSAGVLDAFIDEGIKVDVVYGISAGSANAASFVAGQKGRNKRFYIDYSDDPRYYSVKNYYKTGSLFGLEYIYGELSNTGGLDPIDYDALVSNPTEMVVVATSETGNAHYFTKEDMARDHYEVVMASSALPALCQPVEIDGVKYFDGGVADSLPINKMIEDGCTKFIILTSKPKGYMMKPQKMERIYKRLLKEYPHVKKGLDRRHLNYNSSLTKIRQLEKEGKAFVYTPSPMIPMSTYKTDKEALEMLYKNGLDTAKARMYNLKKFMES